jgi:hypothetical protein
MNKYDKVIERVFFNNYREGDIRVEFNREELADACKELKIERIKNLGDIPYTYRARRELPQSLTDKLNDGSDWIIIGTGVGNYEFRQAQPGKINPSENRQRIKLLDATPEIVKCYAPGTDQQALLTKVRYNRLIDIFTGLTCYSIQNHLRTSIANVGQIEIDEVYLGVNKRGAHFVIPCQAKSPGDRLGIVQVMQDIEFCKNRYPNVLCKPIALQFLTENDVAILELSVDEEDQIFRLSVVDEKHYKLVPKNGITESEIKKICDQE